MCCAYRRQYRLAFLSRKLSPVLHSIEGLFPADQQFEVSARNSDSSGDARDLPNEVFCEIATGKGFLDYSFDLHTFYVGCVSSRFGFANAALCDVVLAK